MKNSNLSNAMVIATLTDEAAESSLFKMATDTILDLVELQGGESKFDEINRSMVADNIAIYAGDDESIKHIFFTHKDEILRVNSELGNLSGLSDTAHMVLLAGRFSAVKYNNSYLKDSSEGGLRGVELIGIAKATQNMYEVRLPPNPFILMVRRALVNTCLELLHTTYSHMSEIYE